MTPQEKKLLHQTIQKFENDKEKMSPIDAEQKLIEILTPLLKYQGFHVEHIGGRIDKGLDFIATKEDFKIGIQYKHTIRRIGASVVASLLGAGINGQYNKVILLTSSSFTSEAKKLVNETMPFIAELMDIDSLKSWTAAIEANYNDSEVIKVLKFFTQRIIELIDKNPRTLDEIEWRDLERVIAEIFDGIGFSVTLTPPSKDGGKDVILECYAEGTKNTFIIEIKHWRSATKVGQKAVKDFVKIITKEKREGGLFLSTYGFTENAAESLTEIEKQKVRFGQETKIVSLCKTYLKRKSGLYVDDELLPQILLNDTN